MSRIKREQVGNDSSGSCGQQRCPRVSRKYPKRAALEISKIQRLFLRSSIPGLAAPSSRCSAGENRQKVKCGVGRRLLPKMSAGDVFIPVFPASFPAERRRSRSCRTFREDFQLLSMMMAAGRRARSRWSSRGSPGEEKQPWARPGVRRDWHS